MMALVTGPNNSGKSAYAEQLARRCCAGSLYYVATMIPYGEEGAARVNKHICQRQGMGFHTVESPYAIVRTTEMDTVLLEDASNLLSNLMFEQQDRNALATAVDRIVSLREHCENLIVVTIDWPWMGSEYNEETHQYIDTLREMNHALSVHADHVVKMAGNRPFIVKGASPCAY